MPSHDPPAGWVLIVSVGSDLADRAAGELWDHGPDGIEERADGATTQLVAGFADEATARRAGAAMLSAVGTAHIEVSAVTDRGWRDRWQAYARPIQVGRLVVTVGTGEATERSHRVEDRRVDLRIDPGPTFGSGAHPTTLAVLSELDLAGSGLRVADIGCGSGVLAVAAALLGATEVDAVDIDPAAADATRANAFANGVDGIVRVVDADLGALRGPYDLVVANIGAATLVELAPLVEPLVGDRLVCSGGLLGRTAAVARAYPTLEPARLRLVDDWPTVTLRRRTGG